VQVDHCHVQGVIFDDLKAAEVVLGFFYGFDIRLDLHKLLQLLTDRLHSADDKNFHRRIRV